MLSCQAADGQVVGCLGLLSLHTCGAFTLGQAQRAPSKVFSGFSFGLLAVALAGRDRKGGMSAGEGD